MTKELEFPWFRYDCIRLAEFFVAPLDFTGSVEWNLIEKKIAHSIHENDGLTSKSYEYLHVFIFCS